MKKKLVILGAGESGVGAALLGQVKGWEVFVSDKGSIAANYKAELDNANIAWEENTHTLDKIFAADEIVKSPGIPEHITLIKELGVRGIPVISEIEFAGKYNTSKTICITGSNGKTTTTMLVYHLLKDAGVDVEMCGNIGVSLARLVAEERQPEWFVIELSSFQLDGMYTFKADIALLLNITPDHLDRYDHKMTNYIKSKFRIALNQGVNDYFIYCADDPNIKRELPKHIFSSNLIPFSQKEIYKKGAYSTSDEMIVKLNNDSMSVYLQELALQGRHNLYNSMAAGIVARVLNIKKKIIRESLASFKGAEHRLEKVVSVRGIDFINDSKATNVNSTWYALECMTKPVIWIAGGTDKGNDYTELHQIAKSKVKALICLGVDNSKLIKSFTNVVPVIKEANSMEEAIKKAYKLGKKDDVVLLSPACASFDLFNNYMDRGEQFKKYAAEL